MEDKTIRIEDYEKLKEVHNRITEILNSSGISCYNAIGILETIKQEVFINSEVDDEQD